MRTGQGRRVVQVRVEDPFTPRGALLIGATGRPDTSLVIIPDHVDEHAGAMMAQEPALFRTLPSEGAERWEIPDVRPGTGGAPRRAIGWVDLGRRVGRIESGLVGGADLGDEPGSLLDELGRRYPGVRWFSERGA